MRVIFTRILTQVCLAALLILLAIPEASCSRKSGCPAENIQVKTGEDGLPKADKPSSGLIPPKKHYKYHHYKKRKRKV